jgi:PBP1b-binding outer membrane lipoprotein LpoB
MFKFDPLNANCSSTSCARLIFFFAALLIIGCGSNAEQQDTVRNRQNEARESADKAISAQQRMAAEFDAMTGAEHLAQIRSLLAEVPDVRKADLGKSQVQAAELHLRAITVGSTEARQAGKLVLKAKQGIEAWNLAQQRKLAAEEKQRKKLETQNAGSEMEAIASVKCKEAIRDRAWSRKNIDFGWLQMPATKFFGKGKWLIQYEVEGTNAFGGSRTQTMTCTMSCFSRESCNALSVR